MNDYTRVLVVDDEEDICFLIKSTLTKVKDVKIETAFSLQKAAEKIDEFKPNIVFLDNHLGDGMGVDFIPTLKLQCKNCKIVMVSAYDTAVDKMKALKNGADAFVSKPFTRKSITDILTVL